MSETEIKGGSQSETLLQQRVRERLDTLGISARAASLKADLGPDALRLILSGRSQSPRADRLQSLAKALECDLNYLLGEAKTNRVTRPASAPVEAPEIQPGSRVTVELELVEDRGPMAMDVRWPDGSTMALARHRFAGLPWKPPPPPPWEPVVGEAVFSPAYGPGIVRAVYEELCWVALPSGPLMTLAAAHLSPPKGEKA